MPLIIGQTAGGILIPILVDDDGVVSVSSAVSSLPTLPAGDNNIGNVDIVSLPALAAGDNNIGNVDVVTLPAIPTGSNVIGKVDARSLGWIGAAWQKNPLELGYSGDKTERKENLVAGAGYNSLAGAGVPAGEIWVVEAIAAANTVKAADRIRLWVFVNGIALFLQEQITTSIGEYVTWSGAVTLSYTDYVGADFQSSDAGDDLYLIYHARRIDIDQ